MRQWRRILSRASTQTGSNARHRPLHLCISPYSDYLSSLALADDCRYRICSISKYARNRAVSIPNSPLTLAKDSLRIVR
jgi:hypothetical protein